MKKRISLFLAILMFIFCTIIPVAATGNEETDSTYSIGITDFIKDVIGEIKVLFGLGFNNKSDVKYTLNKEDVFEENEYTTACHASTVLKLPDGRFMSAWFGGLKEQSDDVKIWVAFRENGVWGEASPIPTEKVVAHWNPVFMDLGTCARLFFKEGADETVWQTMYTDYNYESGTWSEIKEVVAGDTSGGRGPVKNKCLVTSKGLIIAGASSEQGDWRVFFDISQDGGNTWSRTDFIPAKDKLGVTVQAIQPTLWEDNDGNIHALVRTKSGKIYRTDSFDGGYTWCDLYKTRLPNNNSGIDIVKTDNGWLWLVYNPMLSSRAKLMLSVSKDNGKTWEDVQYLENDINLFSEYSYPAIIADGNTLYITYTYNRDKIEFATVTFEG